jgi:two-component system, chemotaxis family, response regulator Rcp1
LVENGACACGVHFNQPWFTHHSLIAPAAPTTQACPKIATPYVAVIQYQHSTYSSPFCGQDLCLAHLSSKVAVLPSRQIEMLLVQETDQQVSQLNTAFQSTQLINIEAVVDCSSAIPHLESRLADSVALPNLILVEQPATQESVDEPSLSNQLEFLSEIKSHPDFRSIPVVIFTNNREATDALNAYSHGACSFVCKPATTSELERLVDRFARYWSQVVQLPESGSSQTPSLTVAGPSIDEHELAAIEPVEILVVDDSEDDIILLREAFADNPLVRFVDAVESGEDALNYLRRSTPYGDARRPGLVLIDINMPKKNGFDVLAEIRNDSQLSKVPVVMLTTSQQESDILKAYSDGACSFISKPINFDHMREIAQHFAMYWSLVADIPQPK